MLVTLLFSSTKRNSFQYGLAYETNTSAPRSKPNIDEEQRKHNSKTTGYVHAASSLARLNGLQRDSILRIFAKRVALKWQLSLLTVSSAKTIGSSFLAVG